jgi:hypothetical protein
MPGTWNDSLVRYKQWGLGGEVASFCECGNDSSGSIRCGEFFDVAQDLLVYQEGLCSME